MMKKTADQWFEAYGVSHKNPINKLIHWICVPAIVMSVVGVLWNIPTPSFFSTIPYLNWGTLVVLAGLLFYLRLSPALAVGMLLYSSLVIGFLAWYETLNLTSVWVMALIVFVVAWIFQFVGHEIEGKKPSFFEDVQFLLIGPAWLLGFIYRRFGIPY